MSAEPEETENKLYKLGSDENMKAITDFIPPSVDYFNDTSLTCAEEHTIYGILTVLHENQIFFQKICKL